MTVTGFADLFAVVLKQNNDGGNSIREALSLRFPRALGCFAKCRSLTHPQHSTQRTEDEQRSIRTGEAIPRDRACTEFKSRLHIQEPRQGP